jgi:threonine aldolase
MSLQRRSFLKNCSLGLVPLLAAPFPSLAADVIGEAAPDAQQWVKFFYDGEWYDEPAYLDLLQTIHKSVPIKADRYGSGGATEALEKKLAEITGKEKAIFMPSGTMANQLAIAVLSGQNSKVIVQDTSHIYRDEADAAQSVHNKRLIPLATDKTFFTADELKNYLDNLPAQEVFQTGIGCVAIENPVRRTDGRMVPIEELKKISAYCKSKNIPMHLDGARLFMAAAWSGQSIKDYGSLFDTVYISLYKYLGAHAGAVLCGSKAVIDQMPHLIKIHGGSMYSNWANTAVALHRLDGFEDRLSKAVRQSEIIFKELNKDPNIRITALDNGTNMYKMKLPAGSGKTTVLRDELAKSFIRLPRPNEDGELMITVNETLIHLPAEQIIRAIKSAVAMAAKA